MHDMTPFLTVSLLKTWERFGSEAAAFNMPY